jgi:hypothetical protein
MEQKKSKRKSRPIAGPKKAAARSSANPTRNNKKSQPGKSVTAAQASGNRTPAVQHDHPANIADRPNKQLDKLSKTLNGLVPKLSGDDCKQEAEQRKKVLAAVTASARNRYELGEQLAKYRRFFKEDGTWTKVCVQIGQVLKCNEKTVRRIVGDFERASVVSGLERAAANDCGIQLEDNKNRDTVRELVTMLENEGPVKDKKEAAVRVANAIKLVSKAKDRKDPAKTTGGAEDLPSKKTRLREASLTALGSYLQTQAQSSEHRLHELSEICSEVLGYRVQVTIPTAVSETASSEVEVI